MTNGEVLRVRAAMKPISHRAARAGRPSTSPRGEPAVAINQRSDACAVPRGSVVMEAMVALVLADAVLEKFGGDSVAETRRNAAGLPRRPRRSGEPDRLMVIVGPPASGKTTVGTAVADGARSSPSATPTTTSRPRRQQRPRRVRRARRAALPRPGGAAVARALAEHDGVLALGGGAVTSAATRELLVAYGAAAGRRLAGRRPALGGQARRPLPGPAPARRQPAGHAAAHARDPRPAVRGGRHRDRAAPAAARPTTSSPTCWRGTAGGRTRPMRR